MFRQFFLTVILFFSANVLFAQESVTEILETTHASNTYETICQIQVNAKPEVVVETLNKFTQQLTDSPFQIFDWAFKGIAKNEVDEKGMSVVFKKIEYTPSSGYLLIVLDIVVPSLPMLKFTNKEFDGNLQVKNTANNGRELHLDIYYSNMVVRKAFGSLTLIPDGDKTLLKVNTSVRFSAFVDLFVTMKNYRSVFEWRVKGFLENLKHDAESNTAAKP